MKTKKKNNRNTLQQFVKKYPLPSGMTVDHIAVKHPETGEKIYVISNWHNGFWYRKIKGSAKQDGQMWPVQYYPSVGNLEVHKDAKKELGL